MSAYSPFGGLGRRPHTQRTTHPTQRTTSSMNDDDKPMILPEGVELHPVTQRGVWVIAWWDMGWHVDSIHETAEAAVFANDYDRRIGFVPFGADLQEVLGP